jgi:endonuclease/exonuclease/phosphatase family metal-dependent hydrolase
MAFCGVVFIAVAAFATESTNTFTVAAYNVENWVLMERNGKADQPKPPAEKEAVFKILAQVRPDVLGVEEMGTADELEDLIGGLHEKGLEYPYREWIEGADSTRHVALLSRFPIARRFSRTDYNYLLNDKPQRIERGILDVEVKVNDSYSFRAVVAHLKSKRQSKIGDQAVMRLEEAKLLRAHVGKALKDNSRLNLITMGDFNDTPESEPIRTIIGELPFNLFDLMPVDSKGGHDTHYWKARDLFSRIDYLIVSPGMSNDYVEGSAHIADVPEWNDGSDHRAVYARFYDHDIGEPTATAPAAKTQAPVTETPAPPAEKSSPPYAMLAIVVVVVIVIAAIIVYRQRPAVGK